MAYNTLVTLICPDRVGLVSTVTGRLFDLGVNLGTTTFSSTEEETPAEFTTICEVPEDVSLDDLKNDLASLPELADANIHVRRFELGPETAPEGSVTHQIECSGRDQPGIIARLTEIFIDFEANIVTMNADRVLGEGGDSYTIRFSVEIPQGRSNACLATLANTAGAMRMIFRFQAVGQSD